MTPSVSSSSSDAVAAARPWRLQRGADRPPSSAAACQGGRAALAGGDPGGGSAPRICSRRPPASGTATAALRRRCSSGHAIRETSPQLRPAMIESCGPGTATSSPAAGKARAVGRRRLDRHDHAAAGRQVGDGAGGEGTDAGRREGGVEVAAAGRGVAGRAPRGRSSGTRPRRPPGSPRSRPTRCRRRARVRAVGVCLDRHPCDDVVVGAVDDLHLGVLGGDRVDARPAPCRSAP